MAKKVTTRNNSARSVKSSAAGAGRKNGNFFKRLRSIIIYMLALYGAHTLVAQYSTTYHKFVQKYTRAFTQSYYDLSSKLSPQPTVIIRSKDDLAKSKYDNLTLGVPAFCDAVIDRHGYALGYSEQHEQPLWVSYKLTAGEVKTKKAKRSGDFRADNAVPTGSAEPEDYKGSFFDRGHLAPAADMSFSLQAMSESFYMSNMSPQRPGFNRGIWKKLEEQVRDLAVKYESLYVISGPIFDYSKMVVTIGKNKVAVPDKYFKVLLNANAANPQAIGFILPNKDIKEDIGKFAVSVDAVEKATGLDFFNALDDSDEEKLESCFDYAWWKPSSSAGKRK